MKGIIKKIKCKKGETLVEILVAVLIIALSAGMFATMYTASMNINLSARRQDEEFFRAVEELENAVENGGDEKTDGVVSYSNRDSGETNNTHVDFFTRNGMTVYRNGGGA